MKKFYLVLGSFVILSVIGYAGVNIAEVEGKYRDYTLQEIVKLNEATAAKLSMLALTAAYNTGYHQAMIDYKIVVATETAKEPK